MNDFERMVLRQAWPGLVGQAFECPRCGDILDCRTAVSLVVYTRPPDDPRQQCLPGVTRPPPQVVAERIVCGTCAPKIEDELNLQGLQVQRDIDGAELFPPKRKKCASR